MQYMYSSPPIAKVIDRWDCCGGTTFVLEKIKPTKKERKRMFGRKNAKIRELRALVAAKNGTIACDNYMREIYRNATRKMAIENEELEKENKELREQLTDIYESRKEWMNEASDALRKIKELEETIKRLKTDALIDSKTQGRLISENATLKCQNDLLISSNKMLIKDFERREDQYHAALDMNVELIRKAVALNEENKKLKKDIAELKAVNTKLMRTFPCSYGVDTFNCRCGGLTDGARG